MFLHVLVCSSNSKIPPSWSKQQPWKPFSGPMQELLSNYSLALLCGNVLALLHPFPEPLHTCTQVGKSGASWITQALLLLCGSISGAMPLTAAIFGAVVTSFFFAVSGLHREMAVRTAYPLVTPAVHTLTSSRGTYVGKCLCIQRRKALQRMLGCAESKPCTESMLAIMLPGNYKRITSAYVQANERRKSEAETAAAAASEAASSPAAGGAEQAHVHALPAAHTNSVYRVAPSMTPEVTGAEHGGAHLNGASSDASSNGANPGGVAAAQPNVRAHCCQVAVRRRLCSPIRWGL